MAGSGSRTRLYILNIGLSESLVGAKAYNEVLEEVLNEVLHRGHIMCLDVDEGGPPIELVSHEYLPDGVDIYLDRMYWTVMGTATLNDGAVYSARLDGTDVQTLVQPGVVHTPKQCVVDGPARKLYFCDREGLRVMRVSLDGGSEPETMIQTGDWRLDHDMADQTKWCVGIAISHRLGKIFWTQKGFSKAGTGRILSANIDPPPGDTSPSSRNDIETVLSGLPEPIDLEFDDERGALYWTDRGELPLGNTLNKKQMVGAPSEGEKMLGYQILAQGFGEAIGLKLDRVKSCIWVADMCGRVWKCDPDRPSKKQKVYEGESSAYTGIAIEHLD